MGKLNLTAGVKALLKWLDKNPGKFGFQMPTKVRPAIPVAEGMDLITYSRTEGWKLTAKGEENL